MLIDVMQIIVSLTMQAVCMVKAEVKKLPEVVRDLADIFVREIVQDVLESRKSLAEERAVVKDRGEKQ